MKTSTKVLLGVGIVGVGIAAYVAYKKGMFNRATGALDSPGYAQLPLNIPLALAKQKVVEQQMTMAQQEEAERLAAEARIVAREQAVRNAPPPPGKVTEALNTAWQYWFGK